MPRIPGVEVDVIRTRYTKTLPADQTIAPGEFFTLLDLKAKGEIERVQIYVTGVVFKNCQFDITVDGVDMWGYEDDGIEIRENLGIGHRNWERGDFILYDNLAKTFEYIRTNIKFKKSVLIKMINNDPSANMTLKKRSTVWYKL